MVSTDIKDWNALIKVWSKIAERRISSFFHPQLSKRDVMKFVKITGVVGLTVTYMVLVSIGSLLAIGAVAYGIMPQNNLKQFPVVPSQSGH